MMVRYYNAETLIEFVKQYTPNINGETTLQCAITAIENAPTADVVEVIRCKDCAKKVDYKGRVMCSKNARVICGELCGLTATSDEHFCSYGERKNM